MSATCGWVYFERPRVVRVGLILTVLHGLADGPARAEALGDVVAELSKTRDHAASVEVNKTKTIGCVGRASVDVRRSYHRSDKQRAHRSCRSPARSSEWKSTDH